MLQPLRRLIAAQPGRLAALCAAVMSFWFAASTALVFMSKFLQQEHGYTPGTVALLFFAGGSIAILGNVVAGRISDQFGRRPALIAFVLTYLTAAACFYNVGSALIPLFWIVLIFTFFAIDVIFNALGSEIFPTAYRSTASAVRSVAATCAAALGLWIEGWLFAATGSHAQAITWMLIVPLITPLVVALWLPETARRSLDEIAPDP